MFYLLNTNVRQWRLSLTTSSHSHKKRRDSLEGSLDWVLFAAELEFAKILVPRLPQNSSNVNIESAGKSKQLFIKYIFFTWTASWSVNINSFYYSDTNLLLIDYACCKLCNIWLLIFENSSTSYHYMEASHWRLVAVITQDRVGDRWQFEKTN